MSKGCYMGSALNVEEYKVFCLFIKPFSIPIENSLQQLLNTKHLYQSLRVSFPDPDSAFISVSDELRTTTGHSIVNARKTFDQYYPLAVNAVWSISNHFGERGSTYLGEHASYKAAIDISPKNIRNYCHVCENVEPYNFVQGSDILNDTHDEDQSTQVFALVFECQGCKGVPEVFLVRREGEKLTLSGRSPIEKLMVAPQIPKSHNKYISDATLAFNSGQILASIFLLRTFIEQFVRSKSSIPKTDDIESVFQNYGSLLPIDFKDRFPSLKSVYDDLSIAIHLADPSDQTYLKAKEEIEHHFEGKKAFRIPD